MHWTTHLALHLSGSHQQLNPSTTCRWTPFTHCIWVSIFYNPSSMMLQTTIRQITGMTCPHRQNSILINTQRLLIHRDIWIWTRNHWNTISTPLWQSSSERLAHQRMVLLLKLVIHLERLMHWFLWRHQRMTHSLLNLLEKWPSGVGDMYPYLLILSYLLFFVSFSPYYPLCFTSHMINLSVNNCDYRRLYSG